VKFRFLAQFEVSVLPDDFRTRGFLLRRLPRARFFSLFFFSFSCCSVEKKININNKNRVRGGIEQKRRRRGRVAVAMIAGSIDFFARYNSGQAQAARFSPRAASGTERVRMRVQKNSWETVASPEDDGIR